MDAILGDLPRVEGLASVMESWEPYATTIYARIRIGPNAA
jgi:hypothetical protein